MLTSLRAKRYGRPFAVRDYAPLLAPPDDAALVLAMSRGDRDALGQLYDRYAGLLLAIGTRMLHDVGEAQEVLHEVFVEAFRAAHGYEPARGTVRAWLATRMRSRSLDRIKSHGRSRTVDIETVGDVPARDDGGAPTGDEARLRGALDALPVDQRAVIELAYFDGLSSSEIASRLSIPVGTVKSRTAAAFGKLRGLLGAS